MIVFSFRHQPTDAVCLIPLLQKLGKRPIECGLPPLDHAAILLHGIRCFADGQPLGKTFPEEIGVVVEHCFERLLGKRKILAHGLICLAVGYADVLLPFPDEFVSPQVHPVVFADVLGVFVVGSAATDGALRVLVINITDLGKQLIAWHSQRPTISYSETKIFDKYFDQLFHRDYAPENVQALNVMFAAVYEKWGKENPMGLNETLLAMKAYAPYHQLFAISVILCEINKMNDSVPSPSVALRKMTESGLLDYIVEMAGNCLNMAMETAQDTVAADTGKLFVPQNWIKSKASLKDIRAAVKQMVASLKMLPDGKKVLARLNEGLAMNKEDFEARWTAD